MITVPVPDMARPEAAADRDVAGSVLRYLFRFRRLVDRSEPCAEVPCAECARPHLATIQSFVDRSEPIRFVVLAFPAKSPNRTKVLGRLPDLAELLAIDFLRSFCEHIGHFYPPGARITVCSDGHVFSDLVGVPDEHVTDYRQHLQDVIDQTGSGSVDLYTLDDAYGRGDYPGLRARLCGEYAAPVERLRGQVTTDPAARALFNGIHRFMVEDQLVLRTGVSKTRLRADCKDLAYRVIQRSNAWSRLVADAFPDAVRLSIHPQPCHAEKIGIHLIRTRDNWLTPWHGVVLDTGDTYTLVKRRDAERQGATVVWRNHRPSHFIAPHLTFQEELP